MPLSDELVNSYVHTVIDETGPNISSDSTTTNDSNQDLNKHTETDTGYTSNTKLDCAVEKDSGENSNKSCRRTARSTASDLCQT